MQDDDVKVVEADNAEELKRRIARGVNIQAEDDWGFTLLHFAAANGSVDCAKVLVERGADVSKGDRGMWTPLHLAVIEAARSGHVGCAQILVGAKAEVDAKSDVGRTPLHLAADYGIKACVQLLVWRDHQLRFPPLYRDPQRLIPLAQVDPVNNDGRTPLAYAIRGNQPPCAELLYDAGAKIQHFEGDVPVWMEAIMNKRANFKRAYVATYGCFFMRRLHQSSSSNGFQPQKDIARIMVSMVHELRFHDAWIAASENDRAPKRVKE